jgi:hypothetical protein
MNPLLGRPFLRALMVIVPGFLAALYLAAQLGHGDIPLVAYFLIGVAVLITVKFSTRYIRLEALVLGVLLFGYIVGQSGFGHFSFSAQRGIYLGEIGLVICSAAILTRLAFTRERIVPKQPLAWGILGLMLIGALRFIYDIRTSMNQMDVVRDFATIYYAAFFFIALNICRHSGSRLFLQRTITVALVCAIFVSSVFFVVPSSLNYLIVHGRPFIEPRADLTGSFMGFACILFFFKSQRSWRFGWTLLSFAAFVALLLPLSRATFLGFAAALMLLMLSGQGRFLLNLAIFCVVGVMILTPVVLSVKSAGETTYATMLRDKILSIVEPFGSKRTFASEVGDASAGNNEFRAAWWQSVIDETNEKSPVIGLGFGYDLAKRFLLSYTAAINRYEFDTRSPHSILLTIYGRMGIIGILTFFVVAFYILRSALRCANAVRNDKTPAIDIALWCGVIAILITSSFGVMLEGPMAAIVFWSLLGMASYREWERLQPAPETVAQKTESWLMRPTASPVASRFA